MGTTKDTDGKPVLSYIPYSALERISRVREFGNKKYGGDAGWMEVDYIDFLEAAARHIHKYLTSYRYGDGYTVDEESGLSHIDHAACSLVLAVALHEMESEFRVAPAEANLTPYRFNDHEDRLASIDAEQSSSSFSKNEGI